MGTFIGHILGGIGFTLIGLWHLFSTLRNYAESPWNFQSRPWFPTRWRGKYLKYLELYAIIVGSCTSIAAELFICLKKHQPFEDDWSIGSNHLSNFEHSTIALCFAFYGLTCLLSDVLKIHLPRGMLQVMGAFAFSQQLMMFHFHSTDHIGLEGHYHLLLQLPIVVSLLAAMLEIAAPKVFVIPFVRAVTVLFQGVWLMQMSLTLYIPSLVPTGCDIIQKDGTTEVRCGTEMADMRAKALANLYFSWYAVAVLSCSIVLYTRMLYRKSNKQIQYEPLLSSLKVHPHQDGHRNLKDVDAEQSPRSSHDDGSNTAESDVEMQGMTPVSLER